MIINGEILKVVSTLGDDQAIAVVGFDFPLPLEVPHLDLSVTEGVPTIDQVAKAVASMLTVGSVTLPEEMDEGTLTAWFTEDQKRPLSYRQFKVVLKNAQFIIRTGDKTPYGAAFITHKLWD